MEPIDCTAWYHNNHGCFSTEIIWPEDVSKDVREKFTRKIMDYIKIIAPLHTIEYKHEPTGTRHFLSRETVTMHKLLIMKQLFNLEIEWGGSNWENYHDGVGVIEIIPCS